MEFTPLDELERRVRNLQAVMERDALDGALLTEKMDLFYFGGSMQQGYLFIPVDQNPLFMVKRNFNRAKEETRWKNVMPLNGLKQLSEYLHDYTRKDIQKLGLELDVLPVNLYNQLERVLANVQFVDLSKSIREIRMIKSEFEIDCFRQASIVAAKVNRQIPGLIKVGKPEIILGTEIESLYRREGHQGILRMRAFNTEMFFGHVYSGANGAASTFLDSCTGGEGVTPACPQGAGWKVLVPHEPIGIDYGSMHCGYVLDHTRVFAIGALAPELERAYDAALQVQESVVSRAVPGAVCCDLYELALEIAAANGLGDFFMGYKGEQVKFIGHGVGLDVDEFPLLSQGSKHILRPGMVFALEPKFIFPGRGMIGLENVWLVTESGLEKISMIPDELVTVPLSGA